ncbi:MAG: asparagine synthase (glutamine-hydrolyzing) [Clostridia bacterium]|nr:asparagine synthase (glutamine-hydrolyzing) [Clostridia bacterium]MDD4376132.1 asparagine synthase (glutamine-hydrolyzing) [Clostridia bacterium]
MCTIYGYINTNEKVKNNKTITEMNGSLKNTNNYYINNNIAMGHSRISLHELLNVTQPYTKTQNNITYSIVFNGELYNRNSIKEKLLDNKNNANNYSDAELILECYIKYNEDCLNIFNGVYSFCIYNDKDNSVFIARDRLGIKPFYYTITNHTFVFSSEIKTLLKHPFVKASISQKEVMEIFSLGPAHSPDSTFFKDVYALQAGHYGIFSDSGFVTKCYWDLKTENNKDDINTVIEKTKFLVSDSLKKQMESNIPVCTMLSGGLDSSILSYLAKEETSLLNTFSIDFRGNKKSFKSNSYQPTEDFEYVNIMKDYLKTKHNAISFSSEDLHYLLKDSMISRDMPGMADIDSSLLAFSKSIKKHGFNIAISGECADEIFGGYPWYYKDKLLNSSTFPWALSENLRENILKKDLCKNYNIREYIKESYDNTINKVVLNSENDFENKFRQINYLTIKWFMTTLVERANSAAKYAGIKIRMPFADYRIFQYIYNIPAKYKLGLLHNNEAIEKYVLRKAFERELPKDIVYRKKSPFPKTYDIAYLDLVKKDIIKIINNPSSPLLSLINKEYVENIISNNGISITENWFGQLMTYPQTLAYLIQINMWLEEYNVSMDI